MSLRTKSGEALTKIFLETFRLNGELLEAGNRIARPYGLTSARWQVMGAINTDGSSITVSEIARIRGLKRQGVQRIVNDLQELKMVTLKANPEHKRAKLVYLTDKGQKVMLKINRAQANWINKLSEKIEEKQMSLTLDLLKTVRKLL